jgi:rod shape-determining protein MreD
MGRGRLMAVAKMVLLLVIAIALQTLLVSRVSVLGVTADIFLIFTVVVAISLGSMEGAIFGFFAGVIADVAFMQPLGVRALVYVLAGYFVGMLASRFGSANPWGVVLVAGGASLSAQLLFGLFQYMMGPRAGFFTMVGTQILPEAVLDALVAVPVYLLLVRLRVISVSHAESGGARSVAE